MTRAISLKKQNNVLPRKIIQVHYSAKKSRSQKKQQVFFIHSWQNFPVIWFFLKTQRIVARKDGVLVFVVGVWGAAGEDGPVGGVTEGWGKTTNRRGEMSEWVVVKIILILKDFLTNNNTYTGSPRYTSLGISHQF